MSEELGQLAASAANTVVTLMLTDAWSRCRSGVISLWQRFRPEQSDGVAHDLDDSQAELERAQNLGDTETEQELLAQWSGRFRRLLRDFPEAADALDALRGEDGSSNGSARGAVIQQMAVASGKGSRVYQAGGSQINH
ncbi:hypothetical protein [Kitasatospora sp. NPDC056181]|uniref:hypothetical protein n=1 Tax=Kitasatospora sp. NPDC056181 TaxID=3345737 RepID=UPI0035E2AAEB